MGANASKITGDGYMEDLQERLKQAFLEELCRRPSTGLTEVRRDGKDDTAIAAVISKEFNRCVGNMSEADFMYHMRTFASACWVRAIKYYLHSNTCLIFIMLRKLIDSNFYLDQIVGKHGINPPGYA